MNKQKLLLITKQNTRRQVGGRELLSALNARILEELLGELLLKYEIAAEALSSLAKTVGLFYGQVDGLDNVVISRILALISKENIRHVFVDGSNYGSVVKAIKLRFPGVKVITFYHNVEARFFLGSLRHQKTFKAFCVLLSNFIAEWLATRFSDKIICMNLRDSEVLFGYYKRRATHISPIALDRPLCVPADTACQVPRIPFALFVGGNFYANLAGIKWFRQYVSPHLNIPLYVVGRGFDIVRKQLEIPGKLIIVGDQENLQEWYRRANYVVSPIFDGSGMKTKVAEALMYGKKIVGTPESFIGYEAALPDAGWCCSSPEAFIQACKALDHELCDMANHTLINIFEKNYSFLAAKNRLREILDLGL